jgi:hypothetical protein
MRKTKRTNSRRKGLSKQTVEMLTVEALRVFKGKPEAVNHPSHYGGEDNPYETIKVLRARLTREEFIGAMKFQVWKYNDRALHKGNELEDYKKAQFYQNYLVDYLEKK